MLPIKKKRPEEEGDDADVGAIASLMNEGSDEPAADDAEKPEEERPTGDPMTLVTELQEKLAELQEALA
jgi:hypothetical protein